MALFYKILFGLYMVLALAMGFRFLSVKPESISIGFLPKLFITITYAFLLFAQIATVKSKGFPAEPWFYIIFVFFSYCIYAAFMPTYKTSGNKFIWFNGLLRRSVLAENIKCIYFYIKKGCCLEIIIKTNEKTKKFSNFFGIDEMLARYAQENKIFTHTVQK